MVEGGKTESSTRRGVLRMENGYKWGTPGIGARSSAVRDFHK